VEKIAFDVRLLLVVVVNVVVDVVVVCQLCSSGGSSCKASRCYEGCSFVFNNDQFSKLPTLVVWFGHQSVFFSWSCRCSRLCPRPYFAQKFEAEPESVLNNDVHFFAKKKLEFLIISAESGFLEFVVCCCCCDEKT
jgi:hypothetical protein